MNEFAVRILFALERSLFEEVMGMCKPSIPVAEFLSVLHVLEAVRKAKKELETECEGEGKIE